MRESESASWTLWESPSELCAKNVTYHLTEQILHCRSELSKICPAVLVQCIRAKIQETNSKLFNHLNQIKTQKLDQLSGP